MSVKQNLSAKYQIFVDPMSVNQMCVDQMSVDQMSVNQKSSEYMFRENKHL